MLSSTHLLRRRILSVANLDEREKSVKMPGLALDWDGESDHPVIDQLRRDHLSTSRCVRCIAEPRSGHLGIDVLVDLRKVVLRESGQNLRGENWGVTIMVSM